jgi:mono/diheme cytochrome c family protein
MPSQPVSDHGGSGSTAAFQTVRHWFVAASVAGAVAIGVAAVAIYAGVYNIAADAPHTPPVYWLLNLVKQRSIAARATAVVVPRDLANQERIAKGADEYAEMCSGCHLAPGMKRTEISQGLYPRAPELNRGSDLTAAEEFWIVKHGVKMTGMPAWGATHDDELLWDVVAFLRKMPELTAAQYQDLVTSAPKTHDDMMQEMDMHNDHGHDDQPLQ